jgi:hypothetical protein
LCAGNPKACGGGLDGSHLRSDLLAHQIKIGLGLQHGDLVGALVDHEHRVALVDDAVEPDVDLGEVSGDPRHDRGD